MTTRCITGEEGDATNDVAGVFGMVRSGTVRTEPDRTEAVTGRLACGATRMAVGDRDVRAGLDACLAGATTGECRTGDAECRVGAAVPFGAVASPDPLSNGFEGSAAPRAAELDAGAPDEAALGGLAEIELEIVPAELDPSGGETDELVETAVVTVVPATDAVAVVIVVPTDAEAVTVPEGDVCVEADTVVAPVPADTDTVVVPVEDTWVPADPTGVEAERVAVLAPDEVVMPAEAPPGGV